MLRNCVPIVINKLALFKYFVVLNISMYTQADDWPSNFCFCCMQLKHPPSIYRATREGSIALFRLIAPLLARLLSLVTTLLALVFVCSSPSSFFCLLFCILYAKLLFCGFSICASLSALFKFKSFFIRTHGHKTQDTSRHKTQQV